MKTHPFDEVPSSYKVAPALKESRSTAGTTPLPPSKTEDSVSITPLAASIQAAEQNTAGTPSSFDAAKVAAIKSAIENGSYTIKSANLADGLIASTREFLGR